MANQVYVLVHAYSDRSGFSVCGVTLLEGVAKAWYRANDECDVYTAELEGEVASWNAGLASWRQFEREEQRGDRR